jgi:hypothetical protein
MSTVRVLLKNGKQLVFLKACTQEKVGNRLIIVDEFYRILADLGNKEIARVEYEEMAEGKAAG